MHKEVYILLDSKKMDEIVFYSYSRSLLTAKDKSGLFIFTDFVTDFCSSKSSRLVEKSFGVTTP